MPIAQARLYDHGMITLHYFPGNASFTPHVLLHEIGVEFALQLVDRTVAAHKEPAYLKLNPNGLIPVLVDDDLVLYETAAICLHLADTHPAASLVPALGSSGRAQFYKWLIWLTNTMQPLLMHYFYPDRIVNADDAAAAAQVRRRAETRIGECLVQIDAQLADAGGPWLLGPHYSAVDPFAFMLCRWTRNFVTPPARAYPHIGPYLQRVFERLAVQKAIATEKLPTPVY